MADVNSPSRVSGKKLFTPHLLAVILASAILRLVLCLTPLHEISLDRVELQTPVTGWKELKEGVWLYKQGYDPYDNGVFHHSPLLLLLFSFFPSLTSFSISIIFTAADIASAILLVKINNLKSELWPIDKLAREKEEVDVWQGWVVAAVYLFSPYTVLSTLANCTIQFSNLAVLLGVYMTLAGRSGLAMASLALATHLSLYPFLLTPLCLLILSRTTAVPLRTTIFNGTPVFLVLLALPIILSAPLLNTTPLQILKSTFGTHLFVPDLKPNIGLHWYFSIEMFDHFRDFFGWVFQLGVAIWVVPMGIKFRDQPLFAVAFMVGVIGMFKSYPSVGDIALFHSVFALFPEALSYMRHPLLTTSLYLYSSLLLPTFHTLWLSGIGSGNANFYYASTLVWAGANGCALVDGLYGMERRMFEVGLRKVRGRELVAGEKIVQG